MGGLDSIAADLVGDYNPRMPLLLTILAAPLAWWDGLFLSSEGPVAETAAPSGRGGRWRRVILWHTY